MGGAEEHVEQGTMLLQSLRSTQSLFLFGLPSGWQSSANAPFTLDDPAHGEKGHNTKIGFGNDGSMCDAMDAMGCGRFLELNNRMEGLKAPINMGVGKLF